MPQPLSKELLLQQGACCGNGCTNCPYQGPQGEKHHKGSTLLAPVRYQETSYVGKMAWGCALYGCLSFGTFWTTLAKLSQMISPPRPPKA